MSPLKVYRALATFEGETAISMAVPKSPKNPHEIRLRRAYEIFQTFEILLEKKRLIRYDPLVIHHRENRGAFPWLTGQYGFA
jgi:hypothetical protein